MPVKTVLDEVRDSADRQAAELHGLVRRGWV
jgi:hypothetical protein